jgi:hypothetical protein
MLTRRQLASLLAATPLIAQTPQPSTTAAPPPDPTAKAAADLAKVTQRLAEIELPMNVEPAFRFTA